MLFLVSNEPQGFQLMPLMYNVSGVVRNCSWQTETLFIKCVKSVNTMCNCHRSAASCRQGKYLGTQEPHQQNSALSIASCFIALLCSKAGDETLLQEDEEAESSVNGDSAFVSWPPRHK